jgi:hypothetical protein
MSDREKKERKQAFSLESGHAAALAAAAEGEGGMILFFFNFFFKFSRRSSNIKFPTTSLLSVLRKDRQHMRYNGTSPNLGRA